MSEKCSWHVRCGKRGLLTDKLTRLPRRQRFVLIDVTEDSGQVRAERVVGTFDRLVRAWHGGYEKVCLKTACLGSQ
jgi:hypothetical protein